MLFNPLNGECELIRIIVIGAAGRMGKTIVSCINDTAGVEVAAGTEAPGSPAIGTDVGTLAGIGEIGANVFGSLEEALGDADAIIDFSSPEASMATVRVAAKAGRALVLGTTGFSAEQIEEIRSLAPSFRCVMAPNMSIGVNVLFKVVHDVAEILGDAYDVEIVEAHHKFKKDAPSGTAVRISEIVAKALGRDLNEVGVYGRRGLDERGKQDIGIHTVRAGDIVGEHRVMFGGMGETLEIFHRAQSRETFARGAVRAAQWAVGHSNGLYDMQDVLGLRA
jgi:4-hydroxy-tetrahydrodipicolinate reductase